MNKKTRKKLEKIKLEKEIRKTLGFYYFLKDEDIPF